MSEYKKAKEYLQAQKMMFTKSMTPEMFLALTLAIEALDRMTPAKPAERDLRELSTAAGHCCPECGYKFPVGENSTHCKECGQVIDWEVI